MPQLNNFPTAKQADPNSCWACAGREISNWYQSLNKSGTNPMYGTDQSFADAWMHATDDPTHSKIDIQQSAAGALEDLEYRNNTDSSALPEAQEIADAINANMPLLAIVGDAPPNPNPNPDYQNGHWVVIVGISDDDATLKVFDPDDGLIHDVDYNDATYHLGSYWQNTSYVDPQ